MGDEGDDGDDGDDAINRSDIGTECGKYKIFLEVVGRVAGVIGYAFPRPRRPTP